MATKDYSSIQEKQVAEYMDWQVVSGSGAAKCHPGDVIGEDWLGECKTHVKPNQPIFFKYTVWQKICEEAMIKHRYPVIFTDDGSQKLSRTWCLFKSNMLNGLDVDTVEMPEKLKSAVNISFSNREINEVIQMHKQNSVSNNPVCINMDWHNESISISDIDTFAELFRE